MTTNLPQNQRVVSGMRPTEKAPPRSLPRCTKKLGGYATQLRMLFLRC